MIIPNEFKELNSIVKNRQSFFRLTIAERLVRKGELIEFNKMIESKWLECATSYLELTIEIRNEIRKKTPTNKYKILFNKLESKILPSENINQNQVDSVYGDLVILKSLTEISREFNVGISSLADHLELNEIIIESSPNTKVTTDAYKILLKKFVESSETDDGFVERRLSYFAKKFNVGISSLVDHLELNEIIIESSPNTKVSEDAYKILLKEFEESSIAISTASSSELISGKSNIKNGKIFSLKSLPTFHIMLKIFKEEHVSDFKILEIGNEKLNNLIRLVVMDNLISDVEKRFLIEKTKELNLPKELAKRAEDYLESNNPFLDRIFELIFSDGIISKVELEFIHEKIIEINLDRKIVNQRFWSYGIHFHLKELQGINDFKNWIVIWYLFANYSSY
ncbi:hypothetical protein N8289_04350, partial [Flavobacteriales bacterium]|nr:hypothetical protein [Flavobacteriales bacterium]